MKLFVCMVAVSLFFVSFILVMTWPAPSNCEASAEAGYLLGKEEGIRSVLKAFTKLENTHGEFYKTEEAEPLQHR